ncbi:MAG: hypothetical protein HKN89_08950 [Eudoraea sp.]|nr:hypothetical protein [Eudoraea sp.]
MDVTFGQTEATILKGVYYVVALHQDNSTPSIKKLSAEGAGMVIQE